MKIIAYIKRDPAIPRDEFNQHYLNQLAPDLLAAQPDIRGMTLNLIEDSFSGGLPGEKMGPEQTVATPDYDAVAEFWIESAGPAVSQLVNIIIQASPGRADVYWADEMIEKNTSAEPPLLRLISPCHPRAELTLPEVFQRWYEHVEKALRIHIGMSSYVRNWHRAALTPNAPAFFGTPMLSFQTLHDWQQCFYNDQAGEQEIAEDVSGFVSHFSPLLTRQHILKHA